MADVQIDLKLGEQDDPIAMIKGFAASINRINSMLEAAVAEARSRGKTWQEIGEALGVTRQSAAERFGKADEREKAIASVIGSLASRGRGRGPTLEEWREADRREDYEREVRRWGSSPPGLRWRS